MKRTVLFAVVLLAGAAAGGCATEGLVPNPVYTSWAAFEPGSSATLEGTRVLAGTSRPVRWTQTLVEKTAAHVVVERSMQVLGEQPAAAPTVTRKQEAAWIEPGASARTRPDAKTADLGAEEIRVKDKTLACKATRVEVHRKADDEMLTTAEDLVLQTSVCPDVPGGTVRIHLVRKNAKGDLELTGTLVDFKAVKGSGK